MAVDRDGRYFVLNERIDSQTLEEAWTSLSEPQKIDIADQVVKVRKQLRSVSSTSIQCAHENAKAFWVDMCNLRQYPNLDEKGKETLERLS
ncbi:hypothetical protein NUU61_003529 [Penicillium alfredii]|uniref:Uncharacterized protein n=1 Tax=Penicillium alfredii TaxID=1506179 RepID=A0A9W9FJI8_9EURO|nr:uncharacterized protein NUU61_003529 [Penicillium alfredii]KAJ5101307.1 hypothetical protein NUU61_003529 [Penicillium alfredii]